MATVELGDDMALEHAHGGMPAGWYRDSDPSRLRWWDGEDWTDRVEQAAPSLRAVPRSAVPAIAGSAVPLSAVSRRSTAVRHVEPLVERNRIAVWAAIVGLVSLIAVVMAWVTPMPEWAVPTIALGGGILTLVLGAVAGRRASQIGTGRGPAVVALSLSALLVLSGIAVVALQLARATLAG
ncbi:DUF2510 domain-containing protein [Microbacterium elymi]|uniref:DUF2510 domain-containing protein n=1 Tax=Microbacterium elymi TaxID=2909587 RepID=A0ABY5NMH8_9MICO|nr:DUF2510 domain-containing protein [Microbacterium elymi]UUT36316.1 DUF2510 domain-containing protein [Microbacterium elymi]